MKDYELVYIIHPDLENTVDKVTDKVADFIKKRKGKITKEDNWGKRKLAYKIAKNDFGIYVVVNFKAEPSSIPTIEKDVTLTEEVMRHLIVKIEEEELVASKKSVKAIEEKNEKKKEETPETPKEKPKVTEKKKTDDKERMKKIDEKLEELLGGEENK